MVLGAGTFQVDGIRKAAALGCHVTTVDYLPDNVGHRYGHHYVNASTVDRTAVLQAARDLRIDGICTFSSDAAVPTVAHVCDQLGLPGPSSKAAETMSAKHRFREFLRSAGLACPGFISGIDIDEMASRVASLPLPLIVKPVDTSGSRGISRLDTSDPTALRAAFDKAQSFSPTRTVCIEEFVAGTEVGGDAILVDGRVSFISITHKYLQDFVVTGHRLPTNISEADQKRVCEHVEEVCEALGYAQGPLNFDAIVGPGGITLLEISARNGGNGIAAVIERATGVDVESATIQLALGRKPHLEGSSQVIRGAASLVFGSTTAGRIERMCTPDELLQRHPFVSLVAFSRSIGDEVHPFEHNANLIGFAVFDCRDSYEYERATEMILDTLDLAIRPG